MSTAPAQQACVQLGQAKRDLLLLSLSPVLASAAATAEAAYGLCSWLLPSGLTVDKTPSGPTTSASHSPKGLPASTCSSSSNQLYQLQSAWQASAALHLAARS